MNKPGRLERVLQRS